MSEKLISPFPKLSEDECEWVHSKLPRLLYNYFFKQVLAGQHGCRQTLVQIFFQKLYDECQSVGIKPEWDPAGESRIATIVGQLNFNVARPERPASTGRARKSAAKSAAQPPRDSNERAGTSGNGPKTPHVGNVSSDSVG